MTDNEIIKAMECCRGTLHNSCYDCPLKDIAFCEDKLMEYALDLINRQKAEIERLQKIIVGFIDEVGTWSNKYDVDISTIHKLPLLAKEDFNIRNKIKSEAIKEFAERLKAYFNDGKDVMYMQTLIHYGIDNLVAEMTEQKG